jgi:glycosyltransferase involved in cell wall biosynthesis
MKASIVVATYNRAGVLDECIAALAGQAVPANVPWEVVFVDNNSVDGTRDVVANWAVRAPIPVRYVFEPRQGKSYAFNAGIAQASGAVLAFTDDDVLVPIEWLSITMEATDRWSADVLGGRILPKWEHAPPDWLQAKRVDNIKPVLRHGPPRPRVFPRDLPCHSADNPPSHFAPILPERGLEVKSGS